MLRLAQQLRAALAAEDWPALAAVNAVMASTLPSLAGPAAWTPAERAALAALHQLHQQAAGRCGEAAAELSKRLHDMQTNKEGWIAYALTNDSADTGNHA